MRNSESRKFVVGWREWAALPELRIQKIKVKVDTGARTSALHAFNIRPFKKKHYDWVKFDVHPLQRNDRIIRSCACSVRDYRWVTDSGGGREKRFVIETQIRLGEEVWPIEITLTDRDQMTFRMLLGRTAMLHRLMVDPAKSYRTKVLGGQPKRKTPLVKKAKIASNLEKE
jgi:hypothetical protein